MAENEDTPPGLILPNGDINWNCPCLGGMAVGPCGVEFREAFSCFHYSTEEPKGKECIEKFASMQECMKQYPELFEEKKKDGEESQGAATEETTGTSEAATEENPETTEASPTAEEKSTTTNEKSDNQEEAVEETKSDSSSVSEEPKPASPASESS